MLHLFGLAVLDRSGARASRGRVLWRNFLAGLPFVLSLPAVLLLALATDPVGAGIALAVLVAGLALLSALLPERSLQDRLAGTWLVPK